ATGPPKVRSCGAARRDRRARLHEEVTEHGQRQCGQRGRDRRQSDLGGWDAQTLTHTSSVPPLPERVKFLSTSKPTCKFYWSSNGLMSLFPKSSRLTSARKQGVQMCSRFPEYALGHDHEPRACRISRMYELWARFARSPSSVTVDAGGTPAR